MICASSGSLFPASQSELLPMPALAYAPAAWFLGVHMLKCLHETSSAASVRTTVSARPSQRLATADKSTQTVASCLRKKKDSDTKTPTKANRHEVVNRSSLVETPDKRARSKSRQSSDSRTSAHRRSRSRQSIDKQREIEKKRATPELPDLRRSKTPSSSLKSQPNKEGMVKGRRCSTGDCPGRLPASCADVDIAKWLKNPVYASDGESDGRRTDRSEMSPPWFDISVAEKKSKDKTPEQTLPMSAVINLVKATKRNVSARVHATQPRMDVVPERPRDINLRKKRTVAPVQTPRVLTANDVAIRQTIEKKLGRRFEDLDHEQLMTISKERMEELTRKYAGRRSQAFGDHPYGRKDHL